MIKLNNRTVTLKMTRGEVCDLLIACNTMPAVVESDKWKKIHDKMREQLDAFDAKLEVEHE